MTNLTKANQRAKELDAARCKGNYYILFFLLKSPVSNFTDLSEIGSWSEVPELARKYRKHNPAGVGKFELFIYNSHIFLKKLVIRVIILF
jgi:hypothetical protein